MTNPIVLAQFAVPGEVTICKGAPATVLEIKRYVPGTHPAGIPIKSDYTAVAVITTRGIRWHGIKDSAQGYGVKDSHQNP